MASTTQSKILSIDEQIKSLKEKRKKELIRLEQSTGKKFIETFNLENQSLEDIYTRIDSLKTLSHDHLNNLSTNEDGTKNDQPNN